MAHPDNMAVDSAGRPLPHSSDEVARIVSEAIRTGTLEAAIIRKGDDVMVQVFGPPSAALLDTLETATNAYRRVLEGH